jgi:ATP-binding cassette, subfamily C, bacterial CydCD
LRLSLQQRLVKEALRHPGILVLTGVLGIGAGAAGIGQAWVFSQVIHGAFLKQQRLAELAGLLAVLAGLAVGRACLNWVADSSASTLAAKVKNRLRRQALDRLLATGPARLHQEQTGELINTLTNGIETLDGYFSQYLPQIGLAIAIPLAILAAVLPIDPLSGVILLLTGPLIPFFMYLIGSTSASLTRRQWTALSRMSAYFLDVIQGLTTLKILGLSKEQAEQIALMSERYRQTTLSVLRVTFLSALALELLTTLGTALVAVQVGLRLLYGQIEFLPAFFVLVVAPEFYLPLRLLGQRFHTGIAGASAAERLLDILDAVAAPGTQPPEKADHPAEAGPEHGEDIVFEGVSFNYGDGQPILQELSLRLPHGKVTALVGASGAGKSTLAGLLLGFIQPTSGYIRLGDRPLAELSQSDWQKQVAWAPQNPYLFNDTALANLRLGDPQANLEAVQQAARLAEAEDFILALPHGYETQIGEGGARLSSGQAQRLALARAFLKNAPLVILDEPSAHLDPLSERKIAEATARLAQGRTVLVIAHRLSTIRQADQVVVLEGGRVVQAGAPERLVQEPGAFQEVLKAGPIPGSDNERKTDKNSSKSESQKGRTTVPTTDFTVTTSEVQKKESLHRTWKSLRFLLDMMRPFRREVAWSILLGFGAVASSAGLMGSAAYIIARAALQPSIADLQVAIVGVRFFGMARGVLRYLERLVSHQTTFLVLARLRTTFYKALEPLAPRRLLYRQSGDLLSRIVSDIASLEDFYVRGAAPLLTALLTALAAGLFFSLFSLWLALGLLLLMLALGAGLPVLGTWLGRRQGPRLVQARARLNASLVDTLQGLGDLLVFGQVDKQRQRVLETAKTLDRLQQISGSHNAALNALGWLMAHLGLWCTLLISIQLAAEGKLERLAIGALALVALASFEAVQALPQAARQLSTQVAATERLLEITQEAGASAPVLETAIELPPSATSLEVQDLDFTYADEAQAVLRGLRLRLEPGQMLAFVGPSGAGKSTLVNLLLRFWEPQRGSIRLFGKDLQQWDPDEARRSIAVLPQQVYLFNGTLADNLRLACPEATEDDMLAACRQAQLGALIEALPQGLHAWLGESGVRLSAGERQRAALARALLKNSALLVLDEPAAHLDAQTWKALREVLRQRRTHQSILLISHQLTGLEEADEILVLEDGKTVERGTFQELIRQDGLFRRMWEVERDGLDCL